MDDSAATILRAVQEDERLASLVGLYLFNDGTETQALCVLSPEELMADLKAVRGLEVVISRYPELASQPDLTGGCLKSRTWTVYITDYGDKSGNSGLDQFLDIFAEKFPGTSFSVVTSATIPTVGNAQVVATIPPHLA